MSNYQQFRILKSNACSLVGRPQKGMRKPKTPVSFETWFLVVFVGWKREAQNSLSYILAWSELNGRVNLQS